MLRRKVHNDGAWSHTADHLLGYEGGSPLPGNQRRGDDDVGRGHILGHHFLLLLVELCRLRFGITALILSVFRSEAQLREFGTEALYLLFDGGGGGGTPPPPPHAPRRAQKPHPPPPPPPDPKTPRAGQGRRRGCWRGGNT